MGLAGSKPSVSACRKATIWFSSVSVKPRAPVVMSRLFGTSGCGQQVSLSTVPGGQCPDVTGNANVVFPFGVVSEKADKPKFGGGGIVTFEGEGMNDDGELLVEMRSALAVGEKGPWDPAAHVRDRRRSRN